MLLLPGFDENIETQGELILQESFQVWDPKTLIRKGRERHLFLFEMSLVFSKEVKDSNGRSKYIYKSKLFVSRWWWKEVSLFFFFKHFIYTFFNNYMKQSYSVLHITLKLIPSDTKTFLF